ncbi:tolloid-like protein 2 [Amphiura filiformis]|uniref:tolloid-like protein 2 n=1 Tax=Amphiura filiformis TaxID=82378 RepID=UPI003B227C24
MAADVGLRPFIWCMFFVGFLCFLFPQKICGQEDCPQYETQLSVNDSVTIQSPGYPNDYQNSIECQWTVTPSAMRRVHVEFLDLQLESGYDFLYVGTIINPRTLRYTTSIGNNTRITSPINESLLFEFTTDSNDTDKGFSLLVTDVEDGDYALCQNGLEIIQESINCYGCPDEQTQLSLNDSVTIQSPGYPNYYQNNIGCEWTVTPSAMRRVQVQFLDFQLEFNFDFLYVGTINNSRALSYTGSVDDTTRIISPINEGLLFEFTTDSSVTVQGFRLLVIDVEDGGKIRN